MPVCSSGDKARGLRRPLHPDYHIRAPSSSVSMPHVLLGDNSKLTLLWHHFRSSRDREHSPAQPPIPFQDLQPLQLPGLVASPDVPLASTDSVGAQHLKSHCNKRKQMEQGDLGPFLPLTLIFAKHINFVPPHSKADLGKAAVNRGSIVSPVSVGNPELTQQLS